MIFYIRTKEKNGERVIYLMDCITHEEAIERHNQGLPVWNEEGKELTEEEIISGEKITEGGK